MDVRDAERRTDGLFDAGVSREPNFLERIIADDLSSGRVTKVITRFPPEPNGHLHIGHAKSICLNFGLAERFGGECNLRFDDTNPTKEETEYVEAIKRDVAWLGASWAKLAYASDYFARFYEWALELVRAGKAYVDFQTPEAIRKNRGTLTEPGTDSPDRNTSVEENLALFEKMRRGDFADGECVLRAKIDMAHPNPEHARSRALPNSPRGAPPHGRRLVHLPHVRLRHGYEDAIEGVTHSICTLEFEDHRPLYDWLLDNVSVPSRPHQYEFARLNLTYTVMQALSSGAGHLRTRARLGRPAPPHHQRPAPPGLHALGDPPFLRPGRCGQGEQHGGGGVPGVGPPG
jgi:glutaminyl-tRNA synthetase